MINSSLGVRSCALTCMILIITATLQAAYYYYYPHFMDEKTEVLRDLVACLMFHQVVRGEWIHSGLTPVLSRFSGKAHDGGEQVGRGWSLRDPRLLALEGGWRQREVPQRSP